MERKPDFSPYSASSAESVGSYWRKNSGFLRKTDTSLCHAAGWSARLARSKGGGFPLAGAGLKSPSAAVVKSHCGERKKEKAREEPGQMRQRKLNAIEPLNH